MKGRGKLWLKAYEKLELKASKKYLTKDRRGEMKSGYRMEGRQNSKRFFRMPCMKEASSIYKEKKNREIRDKDKIRSKNLISSAHWVWCVF